jgi:hypothetical protein
MDPYVAPLRRQPKGPHWPPPTQGNARDKETARSLTKDGCYSFASLPLRLFGDDTLTPHMNCHEPRLKPPPRTSLILDARA